jgi:hypothetical protein
VITQSFNELRRIVDADLFFLFFGTNQFFVVPDWFAIFSPQASHRPAW